MKKFITLCGFLILGSIACGDADVVKAEAINNQTTDTSGYTITIPSEVSIDKNSGKGSFAVSGKAEAQVDLNVSVSSKNNYKLKNKSQKISYSLDKESFHIDNVRSANSKSFNEDFNITLANTNTSFSGSYEDKLVFDITGNKYTYKLDANSLLDGKVEFAGHDYGSFDVYINGQKVADDVSNFEKVYPYGTEYEFKDLKGTVGHHYSGVGTYGLHWKETPLKGKLGIDAMYYKTDDSPYLLATPCYFKFDTNKLTINYHADGAQTWHHFDNITYDVSGKDIAASEKRLFGSHYDGKSGLGDVSRLTKNGYTAKPNTWIVGKNGTKEVSDNVGLAKSQDVAEYCGVLDEFKKNDTVIDLYPIWTPIQSQLNLNANGGTFSDNSTFKTATDKLVYDSSSNANISAYTPTRKGYDFDGWYTDETGGTKVYNADGSAVNGTQYWQNNVYQNIEGTNILRGDDGQDMAKHRLYALDPVGNNIVDDGWINESSLGYGKCKKITINHVHEGSDKTTGTYRKVLDEYCERTSQPANILINKKVLLSFKIKSDSPMLFEKWGLESTSAYMPYTLKTTSEWKTISIETTITESTLSHIHALIFYTLSTTGTYYVGDVSITLDTDIELFAHWTKKKYSTGTVLNIEGSDYIVMSQTDDDKYLVIRKDSIGDRAFQSSTRIDGQNRNTYEDSEIDNYLENDWYNSLSTSMKVAIDPTDIKQSTYANFNDFNSKQETGYNGQIYNIIKRHVFLPSVNEIENVVDLNKSFSICGFVGHNKNIWTRDSIQNSNEKIEAFYGNYRVSGATTYKSNAKAGVRPTFVIDLSKVDYTVTGHVSYK
ncbi:DUF6273 domain-containing protein [Holdemanella biformis]|uniref:DUF6273 domain-containing protein n=1 Tax=Holdemanella biformis TaxID=1735 RepID=UPI0022DECDBD|nr:DUF6273 domain-containing protein [Holdemanella biformis]